MKKRIYLDYVASTPVDPRVRRAMEPYFSDAFGNPGSLHSFGQEAIAAVDIARETVAGTIGADFREVIFTGSATEANNLALRGTLGERRGDVPFGTAVRRLQRPAPAASRRDDSRFARDQAHRASESFPETHPLASPKILVSAIEHESVLETARDLERDGVELVTLPVNRDGVVDLNALRGALDEKTAVVSVMYANNEIGTIQPIADIARIVREFRERKGTPYPLFHTDAVQAFQFLDCNVDSLGVDLMTLSAHKIYGPKGIGALYVRSLDPGGRTLHPLLTGGGQEFELRSGTENVPLIAGFAKAAELVQEHKEEYAERIKALRDRFREGIMELYPRAEANGGGSLIPNVLNVFLPDHDAQDVLTALDIRGVAVSSGSACRARAFEPSYVIKALGYGHERAKRSIRVSFGRPTTRREVDRARAEFGKVIKSI